MADPARPVRLRSEEEWYGRRGVEAQERWRFRGTVERIWRCERGPDGALSFGERGVATYLLGYARTTDAAPKVYVKESRAARELTIDPKTFRGYVDRLEERGLLEAKRDRPNGGVTYYLARLVEAFRDPALPSERVVSITGQNGKLARSEGAAEGTPDRAIRPVGPGDLSIQTGQSARSVRETCPVPLEHVTEHKIELNTEHAALARRFGFDPEFFAHRPRRFAAAHLVASRLTEWGVNAVSGKSRDRRLKKLVADYTFIGVAGAVGYVLGELERRDTEIPLIDPDRTKPCWEHNRAHSLADCPNEQPVRKAGAMFETAIANGWTGVLPGFDDDPYSPRDGGQSVERDIWDTVRNMLRHRVPRMTFETVLKNARLRFDGAQTYTVIVPAYGLPHAHPTTVAIRACLDAIGRPNAEIVFTSEDA